MRLDFAHALVLARAHGCEGCGINDVLDVHHRQARGSGGVHGDAAEAANDARNLLALCRFDCHAATEDADEWARCLAKGWRVAHAYLGDARAVPALLHTANGFGWWLLTADGGYLRVDWDTSRRLDGDALERRSWFDAVDPETLDVLMELEP